MKQNRKQLSKNIVWLLINICSRLFGGYETNKGCYLGDTGILCRIEEENLVIEYQGRTISKEVLPLKTGESYKDVRMFVQNQLIPHVPTAYAKDIKRICTSFHPSKYYVLKYERNYLQNPFTGLWGSGKMSAVKVPFQHRYDMTELLKEKEVPLDKIRWIAAKTSSVKNKFEI